jgi:Uma2 family endonuclease
MREYIENGAHLGWLIDRKNQTVEIYRPNQDVELLEHPITLSGEDVLPGFVLDLTRVWQIYSVSISEVKLVAQASCL